MTTKYQDLSGDELVQAALRWALKKELKVSVLTNHLAVSMDKDQANAVLSGMVADGLVTRTKPRQVFVYVLTDKGREAIE